ncbi:MAG TPA: hypothetical protein V6D15_24570 [Oculatellaceae cyanobacterium]|jgi:hypothetical protein
MQPSDVTTIREFINLNTLTIQKVLNQCWLAVAGNEILINCPTPGVANILQPACESLYNMAIAVGFTELSIVADDYRQHIHADSSLDELQT